MIGLFDSGYGGLTILHGILDVLPQYSYVYFGDNARAPYGSRPPEEIFEFTRQGVAYLFNQGCPLVILACNTASASALRRIQREVLPVHYPDKRVLGILVPTIEQITGVHWSQTEHTMSALGTTTVGVLATEATVASGSYEHEIHKRNPSMRVVQQVGEGLVEAIEAGAEPETIRPLVARSLDSLFARVPEGAAAFSSLLLGCTHYALIADVIRELLPNHVKLYEQPQIVAKSLKKYLDTHPEIANQLESAGLRHFVTTGLAEVVSEHSRQYFGQSIIFKKIELSEDASHA